jgi:hypothetical protein
LIHSKGPLNNQWVLSNAMSPNNKKVKVGLQPL